MSCFRSNFRGDIKAKQAMNKSSSISYNIKLPISNSRGERRVWMEREGEEDLNEAAKRRDERRGR